MSFGRGGLGPARERPPPGTVKGCSGLGRCGSACVTRAPVSVAVVSRSCGLSVMGAVWSALLVGGGLAGALFVWLLRDTGKEGDAEQGKDASPGEAAAPGGDQGGGGGLSPGPSRRELVTKPGILPPCVSRAYLPGGSEVTRGRGQGAEIHLEVSRGLASPSPGRTLPAARVFPGWCARAGWGSRPTPRPWGCPGGLSQVRAPLSRCLRRPPLRTYPCSSSGDGLLCLAELGAVRAAAAAAPLPGLRKGVLRVRRSHDPLQFLSEQGHCLGPNPIASWPPIPHPTEELCLGTLAQRAASHVWTLLSGRQSSGWTLALKAWAEALRLLDGRPFRSCRPSPTLTRTVHGCLKPQGRDT